MSSPKRSKKQIALLNAAKDLFWKHGISRVSVAEICEAAGVSKMTFYRSFDNKVAMAKAVLERETESGMQQFKALYHSELGFEAKIQRIIEMKHEYAQQISEAFLTDIFTNQYEEIQAWLMQQGQVSMMEFRNFLQEGQDQGHIHPAVNLDLLMFFTEQMRQWISNPHLMQLYPDPQTRITELTRFLFYGIHLPSTDSPES